MGKLGCSRNGLGKRFFLEDFYTGRELRDGEQVIIRGKVGSDDQTV